MDKIIADQLWCIATDPLFDLHGNTRIIQMLIKVSSLFDNYLENEKFH